MNSLLIEVDQLLNDAWSENELLEFIERHSDYVENDSAVDTLKLVKNLLSEDVVVK